jgi:hypothetical protein
MSTQSELKQPPSIAVAMAVMSILWVFGIVVFHVRRPKWRLPMRVCFSGSAKHHTG